MERQPEAPGGFRAFIEALAKHEVDFVVCGGVACVLHGVGRVTADLDIAVEMSRPNLQRLLDAATALHLQPRFPEPLSAILDEARRRQWIEEKGAMVLTLVSPDTPVQLDVFLHYPIPFAELRSRANRMKLGEVRFPVSSREDLILAKKAVTPGRTVDQRDIEDLEALIKRDRRA